MANKKKLNMSELLGSSRNETLIEKIAPNKEKVYQKCPCCGETKEVNGSNFYKSYSVLFVNAYDNRMFWCKDCVERLYNSLLDEYKMPLQALYEVCRMLDIYFSKDVVKSVIKQIKKMEKESSLINIYMQKVNSLPQYNRKVFFDSDKLEDEDIAKEKEKYKQTLDYELKQKWGCSHSKDEIDFLESHYSEWVENNDCSKLSTQKLVRLICEKELDIEKARVKGVPTEKLEKALLEIMDKSKLTPKTMEEKHLDEMQKTYGQWIKEIEKYKPCEYFNDKKIYKDYDGIKDYIIRFVLRPLKNLLTGSRDFDKEFNVSDNPSDGSGGDYDGIE